jgi:hypothetical protein
MTTALKAKRAKKADRSPLPPFADVAVIAGREYLIAPLDEFAEWCEDQALLPLVKERLERQERLAVPFAEVEARLDRKKRKKGT